MQECIYITPEFGVKIPPKTSYTDLRERAEAACATLDQLATNGLTIDPCEEDDIVAELIALSYAKDPDSTSKTITDIALAELAPATVKKVSAILDQFGVSVARKAATVRNLVYNKLIIETESQDARIRLKALELLGKTADVGLFVDRRDVHVTHHNSEELREELRSKLLKLKENEDGIYEVVEEVSGD